MNRLMLAVVFTASAAGLAQAIDFSGSLAPDQWSTSSNSWGSPGISQSTPDTIDLTYNFNGNTDAYWQTLYTDFQVTATTTTTYTFDYTLQGFHSWYMAYAQMWVFADDAEGRHWNQLFYREVGGGFEQSGTVSIDVNAGYMWGVTGGGGHYDGTNALQGTITLSNLAPSPGAVTLAGLGGLTINRRRRR